MLEEGVAINESLRMLKNIFRVLGGASEDKPEGKGKSKEIAQYRGNMLTELLQDSVGGNAKTIMFVNLGPAESNSHETLDSLSYGDLVKNIVNEKGGADEDFSEVIRKLKDKLAKYEEKFGTLQ
jgi:kinesin family protein C2/C3